MSDVWITIAVLTVTTVAIRAAGPVLLGGRELPARLDGVIELLAPALLAALIVVETVGPAAELDVDERLAGVLAAAGVLAWRRSSMLATILVAAGVTALLRAL
jgi:branched-subunit amino acid transport protein